MRERRQLDHKSAILLHCEEFTVDDGTSRQPTLVTGLRNGPCRRSSNGTATALTAARKNNPEHCSTYQEIE